MQSRQLRYALFDLDNTLYPKSAGVMEAVSRRICAYMATRLGMDEATINDLRPRYWKQYGTTMRGLFVEYHIDPDDYLRYVHDFAMTDFLTANEELGRALAAMPWYKAIFTNASREHADKTLAALGVSQYFSRVFDITDTGYIGKPDVRAYQRVLDALGAAGPECVIIEDSAVNLRPAKALGMTTVLVGLEEAAERLAVSEAAECLAAGEAAERLAVSEAAERLAAGEAADSADFTIGRIVDVARVAQRLTMGKRVG